MVSKLFVYNIHRQFVFYNITEQCNKRICVWTTHKGPNHKSKFGIDFFFESMSREVLYMYMELFWFILGGNSEIVKKPAMTDDPRKRKPDITRAKKYLNWQPVVSFSLSTNFGDWYRAISLNSSYSAKYVTGFQLQKKNFNTKCLRGLTE